MPPAVKQNTIGSQDTSPEFKIEDLSSETNQRVPETQNARGQAQSSPRPGSIHIPFLDRLRALPEVREIPWRPGQELPPERSIDSPRVQQRGAILLSTRGKVSPTCCSHCEAGYGRFADCITLEQWFQGACSSCIFTSKGNKCSLRFQTSGTADGRALRYHADNPQFLQSYLRNAAENPKPTKKRKRRPTAPQVEAAAEPSQSRSHSHVESPLPVSQDLDTLLQAEIAREQSSGQHDVIHHTEKKQNMQHKPSQPDVAMARGPVTGATPSPYPNEAQKLLPDESGFRDTAALPTERTWHAYHAEKSGTPAVATRQDLVGTVRPGQTAVIDSLPKAKQRQIYGACSGIQGGIEHLQTQLQSLKALLGIDEE